MSKKNNTLVKNASILMIASIISRIIGLLYRRPLGAILGSVGLGYYGYASNLYTILLLISSYSIPMAVSKIVSEKLARKQYKNARVAFKASLIYGCIVGGIGAFACLFLGRWLLPSNQLNALPALRVLAPTIFLSAILGVLRGYFQAHRSMGPTSVSQIIEQIFNAVISVFAAWALIRTFAKDGGVKAAIYGAMGGTMGTGAGVLTGLAFMLFVYWVNRNYFIRRAERDKTASVERYSDVYRELFFLMTPIIMTTFLNNASPYLDGYLYSAIQGLHGVKDTLISAAYGEYSNYFTPVVGIPLALASASASAMMPELSAAFAIKEYDEGNRKVQQAIRLTMFISVPSMVGMTILAYPIMGVLFPASSNTASRLLFLGSLQIVFGAMTVVANSALQSIGRQKEAMINCAIALASNLGILTVLLFLFSRLDIYAVLIAGMSFPVVNSILSLLTMRKVMRFRLEWKKNFAEPLIASAGMGFVTFLVYNLLFNLTKRPSIALIISILLAVFLYLVLYVLISGISEEEIRSFPMGSRIIKLMRALHIYR